MYNLYTIHILYDQASISLAYADNIRYRKRKMNMKMNMIF